MTYIMRKGKWKLHRVMRDQVSWNKSKHCAIYKYSVTYSNGSDIRSAMSKWLIVALLKARWGYGNG